MAIFGQNGLSAAAIYLATIFALYRQKQAGFPDKASLAKVANIISRKQAAASGKKGAEYKAEVTKLRSERYQQYLQAGAARTGKEGVARYKDLQSSSAFATGQSKLGYLR